jgi:ferrochelatase
VLVANLGTPDAPTPRAVRRYLAQFFADRRVFEYPRWLWWPLANGVILNARCFRSAKLYRKIWIEGEGGGSPLLVIGKRQAAALQTALDIASSAPVKVALGMRYGNPSIAAGLAALRAAGADRLLVLPLFPQYSATTVGSAIDSVMATLKTWRWLPEARFITHYHDDPAYIMALVESIRAHWAEHGRPDRLLLSFHGIPQRYFDQGDPYYCQCHKTTRLVAQALGLNEGEYQMTFQSRFGPEAWLQPYTDKTLAAWGAAGLRRVDVICPGFAADCLETIEEMAEENRAVFTEAGGGEYRYIPALNDTPAHIAVLAGLVARHAQGWDGAPTFAEAWAGRLVADERAR